MMDVDFVQRIMREKSCPSEKVSSPKTGIKGKQRKFRNKYNPNNGKNEKDPRDLLATVNDQFNDPEYLNEIGYHLKEDIEKIKKEVIPLRERLHLYMKMEEKAENLPPEAVTLDVLDPQPKKNIDVSLRTNQLNIAITELNNQLNQMQKYYCEKTKIELKNDISIHQEKISDLNMKVDCMNEAIQIQNTQMDELMKSKTREIIDQNNEKINKLTFLLTEMKEEQKEDIDQHFAIVCQREVDPALQNQLAALKRQLHSLQYVKAQRQVELSKQMKRYEIQKKSVSAVIERHIQSSKNSSRNAKMSKRFTRELYNDYKPTKESKPRIHSQNSSSSSDYSIPENDRENAFKRRIFKTTKNDKKYQTSDEQSDIYYLEDVEVQTKEIDFNSLVNGNFGSDPDKGIRFRHHRRRIRKHPKGEQQKRGISQDESPDEEMEINYDFPTNIQFLQFPSSSRNRLQGQQNKTGLVSTSVETKINIQNYLPRTEDSEPNENSTTNTTTNNTTKSEIEFSFDIEKSKAQFNPTTNPKPNNNSHNLNTTVTVFQSEDPVNTISEQTENHQALSQPINSNANNEADINININIQEIPTNAIEQKATTYPLDKDNIEVQKGESNTNEINNNVNVLESDNDPNNSGIRISASFAENAINILGHSKFVSDTEDEEIQKEKNCSSIINNNNYNTDNININNNEETKEEISVSFAETAFPRPRDSYFPRTIQKAEYEAESNDDGEKNDNLQNKNDTFTSICDNLPRPSLTMKGSCCIQTAGAGP